jgi:hypothetical protein
MTLLAHFLEDNVIARFASPYANFLRRPFSISLCRLEFPFCKSLRQKQHFSTYTRPKYYTACVYAGCTTTTHAHQVLFPKIRNGVGFPCHVTRSMILDLVTILLVTPTTSHIFFFFFTSVCACTRETNIFDSTSPPDD